jgi:DNA topoisomerase IB
LTEIDSDFSGRIYRLVQGVALQASCSSKISLAQSSCNHIASAQRSPTAIALDGLMIDSLSPSMLVDMDAPITIDSRNELSELAEMAARSAGLRYVAAGEPGIRRERDGRGFRYLDTRGQVIRDTDVLERIRKLAIPPAYENVWICRNERGHLQATGIDARGRKQYRYHPRWRSVRDGAKFERMVEFGEALPRLRRRVRHDLARKGLPREKVLAVIVALLDSTLVRIGNPEYSRSNKSYGLTTLRDRHVSFVRDGRALLRFRGKGGLEREIVVNDRRLAGIVRRCRQIPGQQLFQYLDDEGERHPVDSGQVNDYLREATGQDFTAKDFRTWGGTLRAIALMGCTPMPELVSERSLTQCINYAIKQVASELGNTPAVCRKSYINPVVFEAWRDGRLHKVVREDLSRAPRKAETLALRFLKRVT